MNRTKWFLTNALIKGVGIFVLYLLRMFVWQGICCLAIAQTVITAVEVLLDWFGNTEIRCLVNQQFPKISKLGSNGTLVFGRPFNFVFKLVIDFFKADFAAIKRDVT